VRNLSVKMRIVLENTLQAKHDQHDTIETQSIVKETSTIYKR